MPLPRYVDPQLAEDDVNRGEEPSYRDRPYEPWGVQGFAVPTFGGLREPGPEAGWSRGATVFDPTGERIRWARGPKGYTRSDERVREDVCERLTFDPRVDASDIEVDVQEGEVILRGFVADRAAKRAAGRDAESVPGVVDVRNELRLRERSR